MNKMKTGIKDNFQKLLCISLLITLIMSRITKTQMDIKQLKSDVEDAIRNYYIEVFKITADNNRTVTIEGEANTLIDKLLI